ncbi:hypothetical protein NUSPORA_02074 [Nucleospora cyclopteri]
MVSKESILPETFVEVFVGTVNYLKGLFQDESYDTSEMKGIKIKVIKNTKETEILYKYVQFIKLQIQNIIRVQIGFFVPEIKDNKESKLILKEIYSCNVKSTEYAIKELCKFVQNIPTEEEYQCKIRIYSNKPLQGDIPLTNCQLIWTIPDLKVYSMGAVSVINEYYEGIKAISRYKGINTQHHNHEGGIRCICTINNDDGNMIQCDKCRFWLHTICLGYFSEEDKRLKEKSGFICQICRGIFDYELRDLGFKRRVVDAMYNENLTNNEALRKRFALSQSKVIKIVAELKAEKFITFVITKKKDRFTIIRDEEAKSKIKELFTGEKEYCYESDFYN